MEAHEKDSGLSRVTDVERPRPLSSDRDPRKPIAPTAGGIEEGILVVEEKAHDAQGKDPGRTIRSERSDEMLLNPEGFYEGSKLRARKDSSVQVVTVRTTAFGREPPAAGTASDSSPGAPARTVTPRTRRRGTSRRCKPRSPSDPTRTRGARRTPSCSPGTPPGPSELRGPERASRSSRP